MHNTPSTARPACLLQVPRRFVLRALPAIACIFIFAASAAAAPPPGKGGGGGGEEPPPTPFKYAIDPISFPEDSTGFLHFDANESRQIVGSMFYSEGGQAGFIYDPALSEAAIDLNTITTGVPDGWSIRRATHVNSFGYISGYIQQDGAEVLTLAPISIDPLGVVEVLPDPGGDTYALAAGINDLGDVVVNYRRSDGSRGAYVYNPYPPFQIGLIDLGLTTSINLRSLQITNSLEVIGEHGDNPWSGIFRATIVPTDSDVSVETFHVVTDQNTGETVTITSLGDTTSSGAFCGTASAAVPINKRQSISESRAFIYDGAFRTLPQLSGALWMNDDGDVANDDSIFHDEGSILLAGTDQALRIVDLLDDDDPITSSVESVGVYQLGPRVNGFPQVIARLNFIDGHEELVILDPIAAQP